jgi:HSP20 family molecular chaperone IbpA
MDKLFNIDKYDDIWELMNFLTTPFADRTKKIQDIGLKKAINRPHNLINIKDDTGKIIGQRLELVTTPFKSEDIKVSVTSNILSVTCGIENKTTNEHEDVIYRGISQQAYSFKIRLADVILKDRITAKNKDGILTIDLPIKTEKEVKPETIVINLNK